jgi:hypothetical protein
MGSAARYTREVLVAVAAVIAPAAWAMRVWGTVED